ncbi:MAG: hypothetical protein AAGC49_13990 [Brevundimonas sp.]
MRIAAALLAGILLLGGCTSDSDDPVEGFTTLAKGDRSPVETSYVLEVAYDEATARQMWDDVVDENLPKGSGDPTARAIYGNLDDVDFDSQVVALFSSGESSTCPSFLSGLSTEGTTIAATTTTPGADGPCTADYHPYVQVVAVDKGDLPAAGELPGAKLTMDGTAMPDASVAVYAKR